jgi:Na+/H+ antiporter NhaD/arsenite permease-like protein
MTEHVPELSSAVTAAFAALLGLMVTLLALEERLHARKSMITGLTAVVALLAGAWLGILPFGAVTLPGGAQVPLPVYIPAVDWEVIAIILGSSLFIDVVSRSGIFSWTAIRLTKLSRGDPLVLLSLYALLTVVFSALLNNVTAMIIVGSLTVVSLTKLQRRSLLLGFLLIEGLLTNLGGLLTLISSVPNIILGQMASIPFVKFLLVAAPYTLVATVVTCWMGARIFGIRRLRTAEEKQAARAQVAAFDESDGIESVAFFRLSWALLAAFILVIASTSVLPYVRDLGMGFVAMAFAVIAMLRYKHEVDRNYAGLDWDLLFFFIFLFVVINVMEHAGVLAVLGVAIGGLTSSGSATGAGALLWSAALASSVTDNVPLAAVMGKILSAQQVPSSSHLWWATIFGTNLGGNFTPIGSASTVVAVAIIHKQGLKLSFAGFVRAAAPFAVVQLALATVYVLVFLR